MLGFFRGLASGLRGMSGPMQTAAGTYGLLGGSYARMFGQGVAGVATGKYGRTAAGALWGGAGGAAWGALSDDTSVLGGMAMGAGIGAAGSRYIGAGVKSVMRANRATSAIGAPMMPMSVLGQRAGNAIWGQMKGDALLVSNKAVNGFTALQGRARRLMG